MKTLPAAPQFNSWQWRLGNQLVTMLAKLGVGPIQTLTTVDRRSGGSHTVPVVPVEWNGARWLVAPYGVVGWVRNVRSDPHVTVRFGRTTSHHVVREVDAGEAAPVLQRYVTIATKTRAHFQARPDAPLADFEDEAERHPVFELMASPAPR